MDLRDLFDAIRRNWLSGATAFTAVMVLGVLAAYLPAERFTASATVLVQPNFENGQLGAVQAVQFMMPSLEAKVESTTFSRQAYRRMDTGSIRRAVRVNALADPGTGILTITTSSGGPEAVAAVANAHAEELVSQPPAGDLVLVTLLERAVTPVSPSSPVRPPILFGASILGVIAGVLVAIAAQSLRKRLDAADEIRTRFGTSVLGEIPVIRRGSRGGLSPRELLKEDAAPEGIEAFQSLRTNLEILLYTHRPQAIAVTSTSVGEGKSMVVANLGWVLASVGHAVTLVDADLRRPSLHRYLEQPFGPGVNLADRTEDPSTLVTSTGVRKLKFVPAGNPDRHPSEVVASGLPLLLEAIEAPDAIVLVDSPPVTGVAETLLIAAMTKAVILVIDTRHLNLQQIERSIYELREKGADVLGVVINRSRLRRSRATRSYYHVPHRRSAPAATAGAGTEDGRGTVPKPTAGQRELG